MNFLKNRRGSFLNKYFLYFIFIYFILITGTTYAYYAYVEENTSVIVGNVVSIDAELKVELVAGNNHDMVPMNNDALSNAINGVGSTNGACIDSLSNLSCQVYRITLINKGSRLKHLTGTVELYAKNGGVYNNLKWQELSSANTVKEGSTVNGMKKSILVDDLTIESKETKVWYIAVWISNIETDQLNMDKGSFGGTVTFESGSGDGCAVVNEYGFYYDASYIVEDGDGECTYEYILHEDGSYDFYSYCDGELSWERHGAPNSLKYSNNLVYKRYMEFVENGMQFIYEDDEVYYLLSNEGLTKNEYGFYYDASYVFTYIEDSEEWEYEFIFHEDGSYDYYEYCDGELSFEYHSVDDYFGYMGNKVFETPWAYKVFDSGFQLMDKDGILYSVDSIAGMTKNEYGFYFGMAYISEEDEDGYTYKLIIYEDGSYNKYKYNSSGEKVGSQYGGVTFEYDKINYGWYSEDWNIEDWLFMEFIGADVLYEYDYGLEFTLDIPCRTYYWSIIDEEFSVTAYNGYTRLDYNGKTLYIGTTPVENAIASGILEEDMTLSSSSEQPWNAYVEEIVAVKVTDTIEPTSLAFWFADMTYLGYVDLAKVDASKVTSMESMLANSIENVNSIIIKTPINIQEDVDLTNVTTRDNLKDKTDGGKYYHSSFVTGNGSTSHHLEWFD